MYHVLNKAKKNNLRLNERLCLLDSLWTTIIGHTEGGVRVCRTGDGGGRVRGNGSYSFSCNSHYFFLCYLCICLLRKKGLEHTKRMAQKLIKTKYIWYICML